MGFAANEQIVDAVEALPVIELRFGKRDLTHLALPPEHLRHQMPEVLDGERQQHAVPALRIGIDPDQRLLVQVF
ncbi:hypothetical protein D3C75_1100380 [compost metagenome]